MLRAKIHIATVTGANLAYDGSISIDETILRKADILPYEQVMISNLNNGERFETYAIPGKKGSGEICLHGPTARKGIIGDKIIIFRINDKPVNQDHQARIPQNTTGFKGFIDPDHLFFINEPAKSLLEQ